MIGEVEEGVMEIVVVMGVRTEIRGETTIIREVVMEVKGGITTIREAAMGIEVEIITTRGVIMEVREVIQLPEGQIRTEEIKEVETETIREEDTDITPLDTKGRGIKFIIVEN